MRVSVSKYVNLEYNLFDSCKSGGDKNIDSSLFDEIKINILK